MKRYVALLRGVNVGGKNKIAMKTLAAMFSEASCQDVVTYIQSGNVIFSADAKVAKSAGRAIASKLEFQTTIVIRSLEDIRRIAVSNPYSDSDRSYVMFLADKPDAERIALLDPNRSPPGEFTVMGSEIYLYIPTGVATTKLTNAYFDSKLKTVSTSRNWRTVQKLLAMMSG